MRSRNENPVNKVANYGETLMAKTEAKEISLSFKNATTATGTFKLGGRSSRSVVVGLGTVSVGIG